MNTAHGRSILQGAAAVAVFALSACASNDGDATYSREKLMKPETCKECHEEHYTQWSGSMHAYAAKDPVFLAMNARGQRETKGELGDFCVKCHAPLAVQEKAITDLSNLDDIPEELQGVTCYFCHQVTDVTDTHNNPLVLANDVTMRGGYPNPLKNKAHHAEYSELFDHDNPALVTKSSKMCGACHDIVVPAHFSGASEDVHLERTYDEWTKTIFAIQPTPEVKATPAGCGSSCHMEKPKKSVPIADYPGVGTRPFLHQHDFPGVDVALTEFPQKDEQKTAIADKLVQSVIVQLCVGQFTGRTTLNIDNAGVGHSLPSGATQDRRMWVELHAYNGDKEIYSSGVVPPGTSVTDLDDPDLWLFRDRALDKDGNPAHMFWNVASIDTSQSRTHGTIPGTSADPAQFKTHVAQSVPAYDVTAARTRPLPTRVTATIHVQPMGFDVLDDLIESKDLDPSIRDAMPIHDIVPDPDAAPGVTLEWTKSTAKPGGSDTGSDPQLCVQTGNVI